MFSPDKGRWRSQRGLRYLSMEFEIIFFNIVETRNCASLHGNRICFITNPPPFGHPLYQGGTVLLFVFQTIRVHVETRYIASLHGNSNGETVVFG